MIFICPWLYLQQHRGGTTPELNKICISTYSGFNHRFGICDRGQFTNIQNNPIKQVAVHFWLHMIVHFDIIQSLLITIKNFFSRITAAHAPKMPVCFKWPLIIWSNGRSLVLIILNIRVWSSVRVLWRLISVLLQLSTNWVETIYSLRKISEVDTLEGLKY